MRRCLAGLLLLAAFGTAVRAADVGFVRIWPQWKNADAFDRISEYLGRGENDGREIVVRTHPAQRAGMYFLVRVKSATPIEGRFVLDVIRPDAPDIRTYSFVVSIPARGRVIELGLTDGDWPGGHDAHPVAWRLALLDAAGRAVASQQSFLWSMPTK